MPQVTLIKLQKNRKIANIFIDNRFATSLDLVTIKKLHLKEGMDISKRDLRKLITESAFEKLFSYAYRFLSYRPRSEKEVTNYLKTKVKLKKVSASSTTIERIIEKLKGQGMIDDRKFAKWWIEQRLRFRQKGARFIRSELRFKGIDSEIIQEFLSDIDEKKAAKKLLKKKKKLFKSEDLKIMRNKIINFLQRRGFSWETIRFVVDENLTKK